ncbi:MAG: glycoside hydrolase family 3 C-terminal domain-containing protein [Bacteroidales bacterium]|nr:glycoside hydrolase family 3 C-terminal domain-containing protein [Bacteroidales bacterium]
MTQDTLRKRAQETLSKLTLEEKCNQLLHEAPGIERLGIKPYNWWSEALHGVARCGRATVFPEPIGQAATFDPELSRRIGEAVSTEGRAKFNIAQQIGNYGEDAGLTYWSPNVNLFRDPRWGRGMETYGEDPLLISRMGVEFIRGMQGDDPAFLKTAACAKHYAVHSGPEKLRHGFNVNPAKRDLFETYLPAFEACVKEGKVESVMSAYNAVYGDSATGSHYLLTEVLRDKWHFKGHVVSDSCAIEDICTGHHLAKDYAEASALSITAGCDVDAGWCHHSLYEAVQRGLCSEADVDRALLNAYMTREKLGILLPDDESPYRNYGEEVIECEAHRALAREAARKGMVLLKNDRTLPLRKDLESLYVGGAYATDTFALMGNYYGISSRMVTYLEGIAERVSAGTKIYHMVGFQGTCPNLNPINYAIREATLKDVAIVSLGVSGLLEGEEGDAIASTNVGDRPDLRIPEHQLEFLRQISKDHKNKIVAIVSGGSALELDEVCRLCDAVIFCWYPGEEGGTALADVLFGDANFSGRLPITFPTSDQALPPFEDYSMEGRTYKWQTEGIQFPFGYGLSYGHVSYRDVAVVSHDADNVTVAVTLSNTSRCAVDEVVQIYVATPWAGQLLPNSTQHVANQQLVAFQHVVLAPDEEQTVQLTIPLTRFATVDAEGERQLVPGRYVITASAAAPCQRSRELGVEMVNTQISL